MSSREHIAFILHTRPYKETSIIAELLTAENQRQPVVIKSVRGRRSSLAAHLQPFASLMLEWRGRGAMKSASRIEPLRMFRLKGQSLLCGFYANELIYRLMAQGQAAEDLFEYYSMLLTGLAADEPPAPLLRRFERQLLGSLGYGVSLTHDADGDLLQDDQNYCFIHETGFQPVYIPKNTTLLFSGRALRAWREDDYSDPALNYQLKLLVRQMLKPLLGSRPLRSRELLQPGKKQEVSLSS
ncbi:DNA repair protein RecO [Spongorhabdus nitratireducens]